LVHTSIASLMLHSSPKGARGVVFYSTPDLAIEVVSPSEDILDGGDTLPGFRLAVIDVFPG